MKTFNKGLAIALAVALFAAPEVGAIKFTNLPVGAMPYPGDSAPKTKGQVYYYFYSGCDPLAYYAGAFDGKTTPATTRLTLEAEGEQDADYASAKEKQTLWKAKYDMLQKQIADLSMQNYTWYRVKATDIENTTDLENLLSWGVGHKLKRTDLAKVSVIKIQEALFGKAGWDFEKAKKLIAFADNVAQHKRLAQAVKDTQETLAALDKAAEDYTTEQARLTAMLADATAALDAHRAKMKTKHMTLSDSTKEGLFDLDKQATIIQAFFRGAFTKRTYTKLHAATNELAATEAELAKPLEAAPETSDTQAHEEWVAKRDERAVLEARREELDREIADLKKALKLDAEDEFPETPVAKQSYAAVVMQEAETLRETAAGLREELKAANRADALARARARHGDLTEQLGAIKDKNSDRAKKLQARIAELTKAIDEADEASVVVATTGPVDPAATPATDKFAKLDAWITAEATRLEEKATKYEAQLSWSWKQIAGFNVGTIVLANVLQNMLEGWAGTHVKGKDKRTKKQKAADMFKALIAWKIYKANFAELGRVFKPAKPAEGKTTPSIGKRAVAFAKRKPFIAIGAGVWVAGNGYMAATGLNAKKLKAKYFPAKAA